MDLANLAKLEFDVISSTKYIYPVFGDFYFCIGYLTNSIASNIWESTIVKILLPQQGCKLVIECHSLRISHIQAYNGF